MTVAGLEGATRTMVGPCSGDVSIPPCYSYINTNYLLVCFSHYNEIRIAWCLLQVCKRSSINGVEKSLERGSDLQTKVSVVILTELPKSSLYVSARHFEGSDQFKL